MVCTLCHKSFTLEPEEGAVAPPSAGPSSSEGGNAPNTVAALVKELSKEKKPVPAVAPVAVPAVERRPPPNYLGLASFAMACFGVGLGSVLHDAMFPFALGLSALVLGITGLLVPVPRESRALLPAAGALVSVLAVIIAAFLPSWAGMTPVWYRQRAARNPGFEAVIALSGKGGMRRAKKGETLWVDASKDALIHGDVRLRVRFALVGPAEFKPGVGPKPPPERCLVIGLRITNAGIARKIGYTTWGEPTQSQERPVLRDNHGKNYSEKTFPPGWVVKGHTAKGSMAPGKWIDDVLVFEPPTPEVDYLRLELPGAAVGTEGRLHVEIPKDVIQFR
jgi:hypothetical protein